jgi:N-acetylneuraminic acid mutarotase
MTSSIIVTAVTRINDTKVKLTTRNMAYGALHTCTVSNVQSQEGAVIDPAHDTGELYILKNKWVEQLASTGVPGSRQRHAMCYDTKNKILLVFGGIPPSNHELWKYNSVTRAWANITPVSSPGDRADMSMVYDSARERTVLFGGEIWGGAVYADTWEFNSTTVTWSQILGLAHNPSARKLHGMAFDSNRNVTVLFGGTTDVGPVYYNDTYEYDGVDWTLLAPASSPSTRNSMMMAYDIERQVTVLFGGSTRVAYLADTWEWNGTNWSQITTATSPSERMGGKLAYDPVRKVCVLFGGYRDGFKNDTWEYDGINWTQVTPVASPSARLYPGLAYDENISSIIFFAGVDSSWSNKQDMYAYNDYKITWRKRAPTTSPTIRHDGAMIYSSVNSAVIMHGGWDGTNYRTETYKWDGSNWSDVTPVPNNIANLRGHGFSNDTDANRVIAFGGMITGAVLKNDTYEWNGSSWSVISPTGGTKPTARRYFAIAYDAYRQKTVLFGGLSGAGNENDTWEFTYSTSTWAQQAPAASPTVRNGGCMVYDPDRETVLMFGGYDGSNRLNQLYEYNGSTWTLITPSGYDVPCVRAYFSMCYDSVRKKIIVFGGNPASGEYLADAWEYDSAANTWERMNAGFDAGVTNPTARYYAMMAHHVSADQIVMFGGYVGGASNAETWTYVP